MIHKAYDTYNHFAVEREGVKEDYRGNEMMLSRDLDSEGLYGYTKQTDRYFSCPSFFVKFTSISKSISKNLVKDINIVVVAVFHFAKFQ